MDDLQNSADLASAAAHQPAAIIDVTHDNFMAEVIEASQKQLVLLDFWAEWCEPCKQLTPLLEKLVRQSNGAVKLAKMDIDAYPMVAQQMQVQSIPAVFLFKGGQPVDGFMGALPESALKELIERHLGDGLPPSPTEAGLAQAQAALADNNITDAMQLFAQILQATPDDEAAIAGLAECYVQMGDAAQARTILDMAAADSTHADIVRVRAALALTEKLAEKSSAIGDINTLEAAVAADAHNHQARFDLALAYHAQGAHEAALDALLAIIERQQNWNDDAARKQLLELFVAYGAHDEVVVAARRRLSSLLFR